MPSEFVGVVVGTRTRTIWNIVNTEDDQELDNPRYTAMPQGIFEPLRMLRIPRRNYEGACKTPLDLRHMVDLILRLEKQHG